HEASQAAGALEAYKKALQERLKAIEDDVNNLGPMADLETEKQAVLGHVQRGAASLAGPALETLKQAKGRLDNELQGVRSELDGWQKPPLLNPSRKTILGHLARGAAKEAAAALAEYKKELAELEQVRSELLALGPPRAAQVPTHDALIA